MITRPNPYWCHFSTDYRTRALISKDDRSAAAVHGGYYGEITRMEGKSINRIT
jgi:hypothetical protein